MAKTVCLDPGHGPGCVNGSPDGTYLEHLFALDMAQRVREHLVRRGVTVVLTRTGEEYPPIATRAAVSNKAKADLFLSLHSNAAGNSGWYERRGLSCITTGGSEAAPRNRAAAAILAALPQVVRNGSGRATRTDLGVLNRTDAPAVLIEYGFHTHKEEVALLRSGNYRAMLAEGTARGACAFLGVAWEEPAAPAAQSDPAPWAAAAWAKACRSGVLDGSRPDGPVTREMLAAVLDRLGLLEGEVSA